MVVNHRLAVAAAAVAAKTAALPDFELGKNNTSIAAAAAAIVSATLIVVVVVGDDGRGAVV